MACYRLLHIGGELSPVNETTIRASDVKEHQLAALAFQLCKKRSLNQIETSILKWISRAVPEAASHLILLFGGNPVSEIIRGSVLCDSRPNESDFLLQETSRQQQIGAPRITGLISGFLSGRISPVLMAIWLMKVCYDGLSDSDVTDLTLAMRDSGQIFDYRYAPELGERRVIRRYPTGALSEKVALILPSLLSAVRHEYPLASPFLVARSLGFTGGTWDKLRAIPGFRFPEQGAEAIETMKLTGVAMSVTQGDFNPADREIYKLRSVTGTIESRELIVASIASKQLGVPADRLLLDIRYGPGAFLPDLSEAETTAIHLAEVIQHNGVPCILRYTDTPQPNGMAVGNALEVLEAIAVMGGDSAEMWDQRALAEQKELVISFFATLMSTEFQPKDESWWRSMAEEKFRAGDVFQSFLNILRAHSVAPETVEQIGSNAAAVLLKHKDPQQARAHHAGRLAGIDQRRLGELVNFGLGGGGNEYGRAFDPTAGIVLAKRLGDLVNEGEPLCSVYAGNDTLRANPQVAESVCACFQVQ